MFWCDRKNRSVTTIHEIVGPINILCMKYLPLSCNFFLVGLSQMHFPAGTGVLYSREVFERHGHVIVEKRCGRTFSTAPDVRLRALICTSQSIFFLFYSYIIIIRIIILEEYIIIRKLTDL